MKPINESKLIPIACTTILKPNLNFVFVDI